ncbi:collagen alpha-1(I) chain-like [Melospiza georgiana]|uniref:collagen alpha-1(I) chain-like n=1 Tax=Melospiza georgiana TaxID=44398 RepID=UPI0025AD6473|nr:collagen alpha-1(I) chain-like [Melospiza georgiana]
MKVWGDKEDSRSVGNIPATEEGDQTSHPADTRLPGGPEFRGWAVVSPLSPGYGSGAGSPGTAAPGPSGAGRGSPPSPRVNIRAGSADFPIHPPLRGASPHLPASSHRSAPLSPPPAQAAFPQVQPGLSRVGGPGSVRKLAPSLPSLPGARGGGGSTAQTRFRPPPAARPPSDAEQRFLPCRRRSPPFTAAGSGPRCRAPRLTRPAAPPAAVRGAERCPGRPGPATCCGGASPGRGARSGAQGGAERRAGGAAPPPLPRLPARPRRAAPPGDTERHPGGDGKRCQVRPTARRGQLPAPRGDSGAPGAGPEAEPAGQRQRRAPRTFSRNRPCAPAGTPRVLLRVGIPESRRKRQHPQDLGCHVPLSFSYSAKYRPTLTGRGGGSQRPRRDPRRSSRHPRRASPRALASNGRVLPAKFSRMGTGLAVTWIRRPVCRTPAPLPPAPLLAPRKAPRCTHSPPLGHGGAAGGGDAAPGYWQRTIREPAPPPRVKLPSAPPRKRREESGEGVNFFLPPAPSGAARPLAAPGGRGAPAAPPAPPAAAAPGGSRRRGVSHARSPPPPRFLVRGAAGGREGGRAAGEEECLPVPFPRRSVSPGPGGGGTPLPSAPLRAPTAPLGPRAGCGERSAPGRDGGRRLRSPPPGLRLPSPRPRRCRAGGAGPRCPPACPCVPGYGQAAGASAPHSRGCAGASPPRFRTLTGKSVLTAMLVLK